MIKKGYRFQGVVLALQAENYFVLKENQMNNQQPVLVWDILVRIFHWTLVASFAVAYLTSEDENPWHIYAGYTVLGLIVFRVIWGFVGSR